MINERWGWTWIVRHEHLNVKSSWLSYFQLEGEKKAWIALGV